MASAVVVALVGFVSTLLIPAVVSKLLAPRERWHRLVAVAEAVTVVLVVVPGAREAGFGILALLGVGFVVYVRRLKPGEPCNCFGAYLETDSSAGRLVRSVSVAGAGFCGFGLELFGSTGTTRFPATAAIVGVAAAFTLLIVPAAFSSPRFPGGTQRGVSRI